MEFVRVIVVLQWPVSASRETVYPSAPFVLLSCCFLPLGVYTHTQTNRKLMQANNQKIISQMLKKVVVVMLQYKHNLIHKNDVHDLINLIMLLLL